MPMKLFKFTIFFYMINCYALEIPSYGEQELKNDWSAPFYQEKSRNILFWGSLTTAALILGRNEIVEPFQKDISTKEPLGESAAFFDLMGQMVPNALYMGYQWKFGQIDKRSRRLMLMFKASLFSGLTTFFAKRLINERRPNKGDRNSFPSGHTTTAFAFGTVVALEHPEYAWMAYTFSALVGLSRINDNAHYLHDVTMGATIGMAYAYAFYYSPDKLANFNLAPLKDGAIVGFNHRF